MDWKTATYSFLNPLHVGMVLAGADCHATDAITPYAHQIGIGFQITDDIIGTFGDEAVTGKSSMDDVREGKHTLLVHHALAQGDSEEKDFIHALLGNTEITAKQFGRYKEILHRTGAYDFANTEAKRYIDSALVSLEQESKRWPASKVNFLRGLAEYLLTRVS
jgi:geranylgeranyl pyrophosphate synthase